MTTTIILLPLLVHTRRTHLRIGLNEIKRSVISNKVQAYHNTTQYLHANEYISKRALTSGTAEQPRSFHGCQR